MSRNKEQALPLSIALCDLDFLIPIDSITFQNQMTNKFDPARLKVQLKLVSTRINTTQRTMTAMSTRAHKEVADLLREGKVDRAKLRVKHVIRDDFLSEALEIIYSYVDDVLKSINVIQGSKECEPELIPAVISLIYAATRVDLPELLTIRDQLLDKYGRKFYETHASAVDPRMTVKLSVKHPEAALVERYVGAIAGSFGVEYEEVQVSEENAGEKGKVNESVAVSAPPIEPPAYSTVVPPVQPFSDASNYLPVNYQSQRMASVEALSKTDDAASPSGSTPVPSPKEDSVPDFDDLARRFAALKQRKQ